MAEVSETSADVPKISIEVLDQLDPATFNWDAFASTYKGRALITRYLAIPNLVFTATSPSPRALELARAAALRAIALLKAETWDAESYLRAVRQVDASAHPERADAVDAPSTDEPMDIDSAYGKKGESEGRPDGAWVEKVRSAAEADKAKLEVELSGYLSNLIKESIRLTYLSLAHLALKTGSFPTAQKTFQHIREYSSGPAHHVELGLGIIEAALAFNESGPLAGNVTKVEASLDRLHPPVTGSSQQASATMTTMQVAQNREIQARSQAVRRAVGVKIRVAKAVLALSHNDYARAARELGEVNEEGGLQEWEGQAISTADTALVSAICALATGSREHLRRVLLDRASFHSAVDDSQGWVLDLVRAFVDARYGEAIVILRKAEPYLLLNPLLAPHTARLVSLIRTRAIKQYITPFSSVRISAMAQAFGSSEDEILAEVASLAEAGDLKVKIDLIDRILTIKDKDARADAFRSALGVGAKANAVTQASTLRMRLIEAGIVVDPAPRDLDEGDGPRVPGWDFGSSGGGGAGGGGAGRSTRSRLTGFGQALGSLARKAKA
ncbi:COP9 signalosome complex subunit 1b [Vanrija pseudolonga]|uniref:COP9 signalosome complex subunit 1b n=1 Tax=Vanrija pseudolonga TaxID=143232 RepID=A0AAF0Y3W5_9TREE|nr:COP9 signalosome complex subunit 1b [Vanrija pseudolonga]